MGVAEGRSEADVPCRTAARARLVGRALALWLLALNGNLVASEVLGSSGAWRLVSISPSIERSVFASPDSGLVVLQVGDSLADETWRIHAIDAEGVVIAPFRHNPVRAHVSLKPGDRVPDPSGIRAAHASANQLRSTVEVVEFRAFQEEAREQRK